MQNATAAAKTTVYAGCYIDTDNVQNTPTVHVYSTEQQLVDALLSDIGSTMQGITATTLDELNELLMEYSDNSYDSIAYTVTTV